MNEEIEKAIKHLAEMIPNAADSGDGMKLSQSVTNLAHALGVIRNGEKISANCDERQPDMGADFHIYLAEAHSSRSVFCSLQFLVRLPMGHGYSDCEVTQKIREAVSDLAREKFGSDDYYVTWKTCQVLGPNQSSEPMPAVDAGQV